MSLSVNTWRIDRGSVEWVGPFDIEALVANLPAPLDPSQIKIAVLPRYTRPTGDDDPAWQPFDPEPGGTALGYMTPQVTDYQYLGFWALIADTTEEPWRAPNQVGWLIRT